MATQLDLQEQEQVDALKAFWNEYGNLITWVLILALGAFAAWNGWNWYQREQAVKAAAMHDQLELAVQGGDIDKAARVFADLRERFPRTAYAQQAGLLLAKSEFGRGKAEQARAALNWVIGQASDPEIKTLAQLRLAGIGLDEKKYDEALKALDAAQAPGFEALVADRRGDILLAQGKRPEALAAFKAAWGGLKPTSEYRNVVDAKLTALGAPPVAASGVAP